MYDIFYLSINFCTYIQKNEKIKNCYSESSVQSSSGGLPQFGFQHHLREFLMHSMFSEAVFFAAL